MESTKELLAEDKTWSDSAYHKEYYLRIAYRGPRMEAERPVRVLNNQVGKWSQQEMLTHGERERERELVCVCERERESQR